MDRDNRNALPDKYKLIIIDEHNGNTFSVNITKEIGRGGSCIVYKGIQEDFVGNERVNKDVIIKEFYPKSLEDKLSRSDTMQIIIDDSVSEEFKKLLDIFCNGQAKHILYANNNSGSALPPVTFSGNALGTFYAVSNFAQGTTLSDIDRSKFKLIDALELCSSICEAIGAIHIGGKKNGVITTLNLFLDCKPDNIYVFENRAYLFDFDTVQPYGKLRYYPYSKGWSAPEQIYKDDDSYSYNKKIGFHTDIYSIGAVLLYLLTGKKPIDIGLENIQEGYIWSQIFLEDETGALCDKTFISELDRIIKSILQPDPELRTVDFGESNATIKLKNELTHLVTLAKNTPYKRGFEDTTENIHKAKEDIERSIKKHSIKEMLFGSKKKILITISSFLIAVIILESISFLREKVIMASVNVTESEETSQADIKIAESDEKSQADMEISTIEQDMDKHILLKLSNANHQYEVGLENWRRLDYVRAEREILEARNDISEETSQEEIEVAKINNSLGCLYLDMGRYADAYDYLTYAYVTFRNHLGDDSVEARAVRASIAQYYYNTGKLDEALSDTQYILDNSNEAKEKAIIASTLHLRAMIYDAQGKYDEALTLYEQVLDMYSDISENGKMREQLANYANDPELSQTEKDYYTNSIRWIILTYCNISKVNIHKEDYSAAADAANIGIDMSLSKIGKRNITTSKLYMNLAAAQGNNKDVSSALNSIDLAMRIQLNLFDFQDIFPELVEVYDIYGNLLIMKGDFSKAKKYYEDAVDLAHSSLGNNHPYVAEALDSLGNYYVLCGDAEKAVEYLEQSIEIQKNILAENHPDTAKMYYDLAMAQIAAGSINDANENLLNAKKICDMWDMEGSLRNNIYEALGQ